jgi:hypothetical protein
MKITAPLVSALIILALIGCTPAADESTGTDDSGSSDSTEDSGTDDAGTDDAATDDGGFAGVTLAGTGDYTVPDQAPIGGYELPEFQDGLPDGCTWTTYEDENVLGNGVDNGQFVFLTDVTTRFVTDGCPDWVQFE